MTKFLKILIGLVVFLPSCCAASVLQDQDTAIRNIFNRNVLAKQRERRAVSFIQPGAMVGGVSFEETSGNTLKALQDSFNNIPLSNIPAPVFRTGEYNNFLTLKELFEIWLGALAINVRQDVETALRQVGSKYSGALSQSQQANIRHDVPLWVSSMGLEQITQEVKRNRQTIEANHREFLLRGIDQMVPFLVEPENGARLESVMTDFTVDEFNFYDRNSIILDAMDDSPATRLGHSIRAVSEYFRQIFSLNQRTLEDIFERGFDDYVEANLFGNRQDGLEELRNSQANRESLADALIAKLEGALSSQMSHVQFAIDPADKRALKGMILPMLSEACSYDELKARIVPLLPIQFKNQLQDFLKAYLYSKNLRILDYFFREAFPFETHCISSLGAPFAAHVDRVKILANPPSQDEAEIARRISESVIVDTFQYPNYFFMNIANNFTSHELYRMYLILQRDRRLGLPQQTLLQLMNAGPHAAYTAIQRVNWWELGESLRHAGFDGSGGNVLDILATSIANSAKSFIRNMVFSDPSGVFTLRRSQEIPMLIGGINRGDYICATDDNLAFRLSMGTGNRIDPDNLVVLLYKELGDRLYESGLYSDSELPPNVRMVRPEVWCPFDESMKRFFRKHIAQQPL